jgi:hypothetical protein
MCKFFPTVCVFLFCSFTYQNEFELARKVTSDAVVHVARVETKINFSLHKKVAKRSKNKRKRCEKKVHRKNVGLQNVESQNVENKTSNDKTSTVTIRRHNKTSTITKRRHYKTSTLQNVDTIHFKISLFEIDSFFFQRDDVILYCTGISLFAYDNSKKRSKTKRRHYSKFC